jgi:hypothetical protein
VTEGAEVLGCKSGSFIAEEIGSRDFKKHTCESGERSGTFTVEFDAPNNWVDEWSGPWTVKEGTDDFSGLSGGGEIRAILDLVAKSAVETITGEIQFSK